MAEKFTQVDYAEPHIGRQRQMLTAHPELKSLFGPNSRMFYWTIIIAAVQLAASIWSVQLPWWGFLLLAYTIGAVANHACFVIVHEAAHNLIFRSPAANRWAGIFANIPQGVPSAISFRKYHLLHHRFQGNLEFDADLPSHWEAKMVGSGPIRKSLWLLFFFVFEGCTRPSRLKNVPFMDGWTATNLLVQIAFLVAWYQFFGGIAVAYFFISTAFSIGLHPLGARWIQEHYVFREGQETYSYYGPANAITFNVGFHNEHHDLIMVPWINLPKVKSMAPEFYEPLMAHQSWTKLLFRFLFDRKTTLFSRVTRTIGPASRAETRAVGANAAPALATS